MCRLNQELGELVGPRPPHRGQGRARRAHLLSQRVEVGLLWINQPALPSAEMPFGGLKDSGYGSEGGPEALETYLNTRAISIANV